MIDLVTDAAIAALDFIRFKYDVYYNTTGNKPKIMIISDSYYYALYQSKSFVKLYLPDIEIYYLEGVSVDTVLFPTKGEL